jgi:hypothetical protein
MSVEKVVTIPQAEPSARPAAVAHEWPGPASAPGYAGTPLTPTPDPIAADTARRIVDGAPLSTLSDPLEDAR